MSTVALLPIGEVAANSGVTVSAVRYYHDIGVIATATRIGGKRRFDPDTVGRVSFIRRAQEAGFSLDEIRKLLDDTQGGWRNVVEDKLAEVYERRERLDVMISMLSEMRDCGCEVVASCPSATSC